MRSLKNARILLVNDQWKRLAYRLLDPPTVR